jgi:hypothetical protein
MEKIINANKEQGMAMKVDVENLKDLECPKCSGVYFDSVVRIKILSALQSPDGQERAIQIPLIRCANDQCHYVMEKLGE